MGIAIPPETVNRLTKASLITAILSLILSGFVIWYMLSPHGQASVFVGCVFLLSHFLSLITIASGFTAFLQIAESDQIGKMRAKNRIILGMSISILMFWLPFFYIMLISQG